MQFTTHKRRRPPTVIIVSLIDVLLVLLIIFMVIVPLTPVGLHALVPQPAAKNEPPPPQPSTIVLQVHAAAGGGSRVPLFWPRLRMGWAAAAIFAMEPAPGAPAAMAKKTSRNRGRLGTSGVHLAG